MIAALSAVGGYLVSLRAQDGVALIADVRYLGVVVVIFVVTVVLPPLGMAPMLLRIAHDNGGLEYAMAMLAGAAVWAVVLN